MFSHPKGYLPTVARFMWWIGPAVGMASAFTTGTYIATNLRGKDDKVNYAVGACSAAGVAGAWMRSPVIGFSMCLAFCKSLKKIISTSVQIYVFPAIAAATKKISIEEGWTFFPKDIMDNHKWSGPDSRKFDFTLTAEREKGWTSGK